MTVTNLKKVLDYAVCKNNLDSQWREYNDTHVSELQEDDVYNKKPYCLFYKRV